MTDLAKKYSKHTNKKNYKRLIDFHGESIIATVKLELMANFSFIPASQAIIRNKLKSYDIDEHEFSVYFDGATFEYFPKQLKVTVFISNHYYSFDFTKPQWLGQPVSKDTERALLGAEPK